MRAMNRASGNWRYVPLADRSEPVERQTVITLSPLSGIERAEMWDNVNWVVENDETGEKSVQPRVFRQARELCLQHIVNVENFPVGSPEPWPAKGTREDKDRYLDKFHDLDLLEVGNELRSRSLLGDAEKKS